MSLPAYEAFWSKVQEFHRLRRPDGEFDARRRHQALDWMWDIVQSRLQTDFKRHPAVRRALPSALADVSERRLAP